MKPHNMEKMTTTHAQFATLCQSGVSDEGCVPLNARNARESFHLCYLSNVKQGQMMLASVASVKWNAAEVARSQLGNFLWMLHHSVIFERSRFLCIVIPIFVHCI